MTDALYSVSEGWQEEPIVMVRDKKVAEEIANKLNGIADNDNLYIVLQHPTPIVDSAKAVSACWLYYVQMTKRGTIHHTEKYLTYRVNGKVAPVSRLQSPVDRVGVGRMGYINAYSYTSFEEAERLGKEKLKEIWEQEKTERRERKKKGLEY